jgi:hypothetical protein
VGRARGAAAGCCSGGGPRASDAPPARRLGVPALAAAALTPPSAAPPPPRRPPPHPPPGARDRGHRPLRRRARHVRDARAARRARVRRVVRAAARRGLRRGLGAAADRVRAHAARGEALGRELLAEKGRRLRRADQEQGGAAVRHRPARLGGAAGAVGRRHARRQTQDGALPARRWAGGGLAGEGGSGRREGGRAGAGLAEEAGMEGPWGGGRGPPPLPMRCTRAPTSPACAHPTPRLVHAPPPQAATPSRRSTRPYPTARCRCSRSRRRRGRRRSSRPSGRCAASTPTAWSSRRSFSRATPRGEKWGAAQAAGWRGRGAAARHKQRASPAHAVRPPDPTRPDPFPPR